MRIWLITIGEPVPQDGSNVRLLRTGMLAEFLSDAGHDVVWWTSSFDHNRKVHRVASDAAIVYRPGLRIMLMRSLGYKGNVSLRRLFDHYFIAWKFGQLAEHDLRPDIIVSALPTPELSFVAVRYGQRHRIPVVVDARDMWPDLIIDAIPRMLKLPLAPLIAHLRKVMSDTCRNATAIVGITPAFVKWALSYSGREMRPTDRAFPFGYASTLAPEEAVRSAEDTWRNRGLGGPGARFIIAFVGSIGDPAKYDWPLIADVAVELSNARPDIRFVICGDGEGLPNAKAACAKCRNIDFPGWIGGAEIAALLRMASAGLVPYRDRSDFRASYPNKVSEFLAAHLPIVSTLGGDIADLITQHGCGLSSSVRNDLVAWIVRLHDDTHWRSGLARNAARLFDRQFRAESIHADMCSYLESLVRSGVGA